MPTGIELVFSMGILIYSPLGQPIKLNVQFLYLL